MDTVSGVSSFQTGKLPRKVYINSFVKLVSKMEFTSRDSRSKGFSSLPLPAIHTII